MSSRSTIRRIIVVLGAGLLGLALLLVGSLTLVLSTQAGTGWALSQALRQINGVAGQQVTVASTEGTLVSGLQLSGLEYQSEAAHVTVEQVGISWSPLALMSARLSVPEIILNDVHAEILTPDSATGQISQRTGPLISFTPFPIVIDMGSITVRELVVQQSEQNYAVHELSLSARLQNQSLELAAVDLDSDIADIAGDLVVILNGNLPIDAEFRWQLDGEIYPDLGPTSGMLMLAGDLATLELQHRLQQPITLTSQGSVTTGLTGDELNIDLTHSSDSILLPQLPIENLTLNNFNLSTVGSVAALEIALTAEGESGLTPPATLALYANWQAGTLLLDELQLATETGQLRASGELAAGETMSGALRYQLMETSPLDYLNNELPLEILNLYSSGLVEFSQAESTLQGALRLDEIGGEFGDYPFQGQGQINYVDGALQFENVQLSTAANQLIVEGVLADQLDFNWAVVAPQLNQFIAELSGQLQASGQIFGDVNDVQLIADIAAETVRYNDLFVDDLQISLQRLGQALQGSIEITQAGRRTEERTDNIQSVTVSVDGTESQHQLSLAAISDYGDMELEFQGGFSDLANLNWDGALLTGRLNTDLGEWRTRSGSDITFDTSSFNITSNCWQQNSATICLQVAGESPAEGFSLQLGGQIDKLPIDRVQSSRLPDR